MSNFYFKKDGSFIHDFMFEKHNSSVSVLNYNSPGWTCGLATGNHMAEDWLPQIAPDLAKN